MLVGRCADEHTSLMIMSSVSRGRDVRHQPESDNLVGFMPGFA
jgi:hypothetical protein